MRLCRSIFSDQNYDVTSTLVWILDNIFAVNDQIEKFEYYFFGLKAKEDKATLPDNKQQPF